MEIAEYLSAYAEDDPDVTSGWMNAKRITHRSLGEGGYASADYAEEREDTTAALRQAQDGSKDGERSRTIKPWSFIFQNKESDIMPVNKKALTLVELIIAIALLGVIILGAMSFDMGSRHLLRASETKTQILNEAALILDHITRSAVLGIGDTSQPALSLGVTPYGETILLIQQDTNENGLYDPPADITVGYALDARVGHTTEIFFCPNTQFDHRAGQDPTHPHQVLTRRATLFSVPAGSLTSKTAFVAVALLFDSNRPADPLTNPTVNIQTEIDVPAQPLN